MKKPNVFISWSGERSKAIAQAFFEWLPMVIQAARPFMSSASVDKGSRGLVEIAKALDGIRVGVAFLTPENLKEPWILFEAGALSKTIDDSTRLCTYLLGGLKNADVEPPLGQFQHTSPDKEDTRHLVHTINKAVSEDDPLPEKTLNAIFDQFWPVFEKKLRALPDGPKEVEKRKLEDMVAEILEFTRAESNRRSTSYSYTFTSEGVPLLTNTSPGLVTNAGVPFGNAVPLGNTIQWDWNPPQGELTITGNALPDRLVGRSVQGVTSKDKDGKKT